MTDRILHAINRGGSTAPSGGGATSGTTSALVAANAASLTPEEIALSSRLAHNHTIVVGDSDDEDSDAAREPSAARRRRSAAVIAAVKGKRRVPQTQVRTVKNLNPKKSAKKSAKAASRSSRSRGDSGTPAPPAATRRSARVASRRGGSSTDSNEEYIEDLSSLSETQLRDKLEAVGLKTTGSHPRLVARCERGSDSESDESRVRLSALPTSRGKLVPVPLRRSDEANEDEINEAEANEDGLFTEEEANSIKRRCCEMLEAEARAKGASAPSEKVQKLIDNKFGEAIKLRDQDEPVIPMDQIIDDPDVQMMLDWYDVVVLNGNLGATRKETLMVSLFSFLLL